MKGIKTSGLIGAKMSFFDGIVQWVRGLFKSDWELSDCMAKLADKTKYAENMDVYANTILAEKSYLHKQLDTCNSELKNANTDLHLAQKNTVQLREDITDLQNRINELEQDLSEADPFATVGWTKETLVYQKRYVTDEYGQKKFTSNDVTEYIQTHSAVLKQIVVLANNLYHPKSERETAEAMWSVMHASNGLKIVYRADDYQGTPTGDYWLLPNETIVLQKGDCEDTSILWASLCALAGIPLHRLIIFLGFYGTIGHAWGGYWEPDMRKWLLIESTQSHIFGEGLRPLEGNASYTTYWAFGATQAWKIKDGVVFGEWVRARDDWSLWERIKSWFYIKISGVVRWMRG